LRKLSLKVGEMLNGCSGESRFDRRQKWKGSQGSRVVSVLLVVDTEVGVLV
jgi:hypothetical protein